MSESPGKLALALLLLIGVWVGVYWLWEPRSRAISFAPEPPGSPSGDGTPSPVRLDPPPVPNLGPRPGDAGVPPAPPRTAPPGPVLVAPEFHSHTVQQGETFESISERYFGTKRHASAIVAANPLMDPRRLAPGRVVKVPKDPTNIQGRVEVPPSPNSGAEPTPGSTPTGNPPGAPSPPVEAPKPPEKPAAQAYIVQKGDTLSRIAQRHYGSERYWELIFDANRAVLSTPESLNIGQELKLPPKPE